MCKKMRLSQQKLADSMGVKRGKVAGYFYETQARPEFHDQLAELYHIDMGKFLTRKMNDYNFHLFFTDDKQKADEPKVDYMKKSDIIDLLMGAKVTQDHEERDKLIDRVIALYGKILDENNKLKDELLELLKSKS